MEMSGLLTGLVAGAILAGIIFYLRNKINNIPRDLYETLTTRFNETATALKLAEDRLVNLQQDYRQLGLARDQQETALNALRAAMAVGETVRENQVQKLAEQSASLAAQLIQLTQKEDRIIALTLDNHNLGTQFRTISEKLASQKSEFADLQQTAHLQFEKIANQIFEEKSGRFTATNKANIESLLKPLGENIDAFKKKVEDTYDKESQQRFSLEQRVKELVEQTNKVSAEANNLASALKGQSKKQGNWGEVILESILQKSGLVKDREYFLQPNIKNEEGKNLRPDVLVHLPDNRIIIIDSKVSLVSYDRFCASDKAEEQLQYLADHVKSIYAHIDGLHEKKYDNLESALDFTMMFIPIEPAYLVAIQADPELWAHACAKRILLISPTNLIACLKLIADLWKREMQSKNALEIVKRGELLYEKFVSFAESLEDVGKHLGRSQQAYSNAISQLKTGYGNLAGQAMKLKSLGLKSGREIPQTMIPDESEREDAASSALPPENLPG